MASNEKDITKSTALSQIIPLLGKDPRPNFCCALLCALFRVSRSIVC